MVPGEVQPKPPKPPKVKRKKAEREHWILRIPEMTPWMFAYARWLAEHPEALLSVSGMRVRRRTPTTIERMVAASRFAKRTIDSCSIALVEKRPDFELYFKRIREDAHFMAKEAMRGQLAQAIENRAEGMKMAMEEKDHTEIRLYTQFAADMAFPRKLQEGQAAPRITINVGSGEAKALLAKVFSGEEQVPDVEYEVIEPKRLNPGDEEDR